MQKVGAPTQGGNGSHPAPVSHGGGGASDRALLFLGLCFLRRSDNPSIDGLVAEVKQAEAALSASPLDMAVKAAVEKLDGQYDDDPPF
jgi:hypothetical protein